jgi:purine catabolism regulator
VNAVVEQDPATAAAPGAGLAVSGPDGSTWLRVVDLLNTGHLGLEVLAGQSGLSRRVTFSHVSELGEPALWLDGGELLLTTGLGLPADAAGQVRYVESLHEARAAGLGVGPRKPPLTDAMLARADELSFPVLSVPYRVPYISIAHLIADANQNAAQRRLVIHVRIFDALRLRQGRRAPVQQLFSELEDITRYRLALVSAAGRPVFPDMHGIDDDLLQHIRAADRDHVAVRGGYALAIPVGSRLAGYLVAREREGLEPAGLSAVRHVATVSALVVADLYREREAQRRAGAESLAELFRGRLSSDQARSRLLEHGIDADTGVVLAVFSGATGDVDGEELHHRFTDDDVPHLMLRLDELYCLLPDDASTLDRIADALKTTVGLSARVAAPASLGVARRQALWAAARAGDRDGPRVVRFGVSDGFAHWLPADVEALRQLVVTTLGPIEDYDTQHNTQLVSSLETFFRHRRRLTDAANELYVHKHTLAYRLRRVEELTGRDLSTMDDQSELWLALKALPIVRGLDEPLDD